MKVLRELVGRRRATGASQYRIAELMDLPQSNVSRIETLLESGGNLTIHTVERYIEAVETVEADVTDGAA